MPQKVRPDGETRALVKEHRERGLKPREIALLLGISTQAVYQHLDNLKREEKAS